jgi:hypothetical protein
MLRISLLMLAALSSAACRLNFDPNEEDGDGDSANYADSLDANNVVARQSGVGMRSGAWWGDINANDTNQIWADVLDAIPGADLYEPFTFHFGCALPQSAAFKSTVLDSASIQLDGTTLRTIDNPDATETFEYTLDPAQHQAGWHEIRIRCKAQETAGTETDQVTAATAGFPIRLRGGTSSYLTHGGGQDFVDTHGWYSRGVGYVYVTILDVVELAKKQSGVIQLELDTRTSGDTVLDQLVVYVDDRVISDLAGPTERHTIDLDTTVLTNGTHELTIRARALETAFSERPGQQLAAQVELSFDVAN